MKQTALDWLGYNWLEYKFSDLNISTKDVHKFLLLFEKAKEMEKEQIKDAYTEGVWWGHKSDSEKYYKQNYSEQ